LPPVAAVWLTSVSSHSLHSFNLWKTRNQAPETRPKIAQQDMKKQNLKVKFLGFFYWTIRVNVK
jgi:hypothetical protein